MTENTGDSFTYRFSHGRSGTDQSPENPLFRSLRFLMEKGRPQKAVTLCKMGLLEKVPDQPVRWFGVFVLSAGDRLLYFPGFFQPNGRLLAYAGTSQMADRGFRTDHASLESDLDTWHLTEDPPRRRHQFGPKTRDLGEGRVLWFGMSVAQEEIFREIRYETVMAKDVPSSDSKRRFKSFQGAAFADPNHVIPRPPSSRPGENEFLHFLFIVGPEGFPMYDGQALLTPHGAPWVEPPLPDPLKDVHFRSHRIPVGGGLEVEIAAGKLPGQLQVPVAFTSS